MGTSLQQRRVTILLVICKHLNPAFRLESQLQIPIHTSFINVGSERVREDDVVSAWLDRIYSSAEDRKLYMEKELVFTSLFLLLTYFSETGMFLKCNLLSS